MEHEYTVKNNTLYRDGEPIMTHHDLVKLTQLAARMNQLNRTRAAFKDMMRANRSVCV